MYEAVIDAVIDEETVDAPTAFHRLQAFQSAVSDVDRSFGKWLAFSDGPDMIALDDEARFVPMLKENAEQLDLDYPGRHLPGCVMIELTTAATRAAWKKPGKIDVKYTPWLGRLTLSIQSPIEALGENNVAGVIQSLLVATAASVDTKFIGVDVTVPSSGPVTFDTYARNHQLFPHRRWLGWMGFVPELVLPRHIPEAAALEVVKGKGTVIVAVDECFDLNNPAHLKRVHEVELRMATVGLLDVTDASLLK